jgi:succinate dehydrogenase/fumarate reductase flavoprotein subunit
VIINFYHPGLEIKTDYIIKSSDPDRLLRCERFHYTGGKQKRQAIMGHQFKFDVIIIGSGAAGLSAALHLPSSLKVAVLAKTPGEQHSSYWAQGGISAVLEPDDSVDQHTQDTIEAGAGLCDEAVVRFCATAGRENIEWLAQLGMPFSRDRQDISDSGFHRHTYWNATIFASSTSMLRST